MVCYFRRCKITIAKISSLPSYVIIVPSHPYSILIASQRTPAKHIVTHSSSLSNNEKTVPAQNMKPQINPTQQTKLFGITIFLGPLSDLFFNHNQVNKHIKQIKIYRIIVRKAKIISYS